LLAAAFAVGFASAGCGDRADPADPAAPAAPADPVAPPAAAASRAQPIATPRLTADDTEVARVNGRPVWSSCVALQAQPPATRALGPAGARSDPRDPAQRRAAALDQCIAFELLAQAAEARGLGAAPEVGAAVKRAAVNRLVATEFEPRYQAPGDLKPAVDAVMQRNAWRMHVPQLRSSAFARFTVPKGAPPELDAKAHALADQLARELAGQTGLYSVHLTEAATRIAAGSGVKLDTSEVKPSHRDSLVAPYADALYAIPEIGRIAPAVRTEWGWDVVLWTGGIEAQDRTRDEVVAEIFPELRRRQFQLWATQLARQLGVHVEVDQTAVARLDSEDAP
jgi:hypothetical protein